MTAVGLTLPLASFLSPSFGELALIGVIALLLYGSDLPQVIRSWGKTYGEFRRQLNGMKSELNDVIYAEPEAPRKLQYYPEFQHDAQREADEATEAEASGEAVVSAENDAASGEIVAGGETVRHDTHGAA